MALDQISLTDDHPKDGAWPNMFSSDAVEVNVFFYSFCSLFSLSPLVDKVCASILKVIAFAMCCLYPSGSPLRAPSLALLLVVHLAAQ